MMQIKNEPYVLPSKSIMKASPVLRTFKRDLSTTFCEKENVSLNASNNHLWDVQVNMENRNVSTFFSN